MQRGGTPAAFGVAYQHGGGVEADDFYQGFGGEFGEVARAGGALKDAEDGFEPAEDDLLVHGVEVDAAEPCFDGLTTRRHSAFGQGVEVEVFVFGRFDADGIAAELRENRNFGNGGFAGIEDFVGA